MTVREIIQELQKYPPDTETVVHMSLDDGGWVVGALKEIRMDPQKELENIVDLLCMPFFRDPIGYECSRCKTIFREEGDIIHGELLCETCSNKELERAIE